MQQCTKAGHQGPLPTVKSPLNAATFHRHIQLRGAVLTPQLPSHPSVTSACVYFLSISPPSFLFFLCVAAPTHEHTEHPASHRAHCSIALADGLLRAAVSVLPLNPHAKWSYPVDPAQGSPVHMAAPCNLACLCQQPTPAYKQYPEIGTRPSRISCHLCGSGSCPT